MSNTRYKLTLIVDKLKTVPECQFNMHMWYRTNCDTVGCVIGHACQVPEIQEMGLTLETYNVKYDKVTGEAVQKLWRPRFQENDDYSSFGYFGISRFLGIYEEDAEYLFAPSSYGDNYPPTKDNVVKRLEQFIACLGD